MQDEIIFIYLFLVIVLYYQKWNRDIGLFKEEVGAIADGALSRCGIEVLATCIESGLFVFHFMPLVFSQLLLCCQFIIFRPSLPLSVPGVLYHLSIWRLLLHSFARSFCCFFFFRLLRQRYFKLPVRWSYCAQSSWSSRPAVSRMINRLIVAGCSAVDLHLFGDFWPFSLFFSIYREFL